MYFMAKDSFILLNLKDDSTKSIAHTLQNPTCKRILGYLAENEATESQIAKDLGLAISTVHYNLGILTKANLVLAEEYHYSEKGREVLHYKIANKFIIIAPGETKGLKTRLRQGLKSLLPLALITVGGSFIVNLFTQTREASSALRPVLEVGADQMASAPMAMGKSTEIVATTEPLSPVWWFAIGASVIILSVLFYQILKKK